MMSNSFLFLPILIQNELLKGILIILHFLIPILNSFYADWCCLKPIEHLQRLSMDVDSNTNANNTGDNNNNDSANSDTNPNANQSQQFHVVDVAFPFNTKRGRVQAAAWDYWNRIKRTVYLDATMQTRIGKTKVYGICKFCGECKSQDLVVMLRHTSKFCPLANDNAKGKAAEILKTTLNTRQPKRKRRRVEQADAERDDSNYSPSASLNNDQSVPNGNNNGNANANPMRNANSASSSAPALEAKEPESGYESPPETNSLFEDVHFIERRKGDSAQPLRCYTNELPPTVIAKLDHMIWKWVLVRDHAFTVTEEDELQAI